MARRLIAHVASGLLHVTAVATAAWSSSHTTRHAAPDVALPRAMTVFVVPREDGSASPGLNPIDPAAQELMRRNRGSATVALPTFIVNIEKIGDRASLLFPFLTPGLALEHFAIVPPDQSREMFHDPFAPAHALSKSARRLPALAMADRAVQGLIDRTWSRRDRWTPFQEVLKLADTYNANAGKLPYLLHAYQRQNGLQLYVDSSIRDPRLWTEL